MRQRIFNLSVDRIKNQNAVSNQAERLALIDDETNARTDRRTIQTLYAILTRSRARAGWRDAAENARLNGRYLGLAQRLIAHDFEAACFRLKIDCGLAEAIAGLTSDQIETGLSVVMVAAPGVARGVDGQIAEKTANSEQEQAHENIHSYRSLSAR